MYVVIAVFRKVGRFMFYTIQLTLNLPLHYLQVTEQISLQKVNMPHH